MNSLPRKRLQADDKVTYRSSKEALKSEFNGEALAIDAVKNGYAYCVKQNGYYTTWIECSELLRGNGHPTVGVTS
ncbi:MAG: hypothetical protein AAGF01_01595 [Cyanobacteria bacterium P01_G01_bin.38]